MISQGNPGGVPTRRQSPRIWARNRHFACWLLASEYPEIEDHEYSDRLKSLQKCFYKEITNTNQFLPKLVVLLNSRILFLDQSWNQCLGLERNQNKWHLLSNIKKYEKIRQAFFWLGKAPSNSIKAMHDFDASIEMWIRKTVTKLNHGKLHKGITPKGKQNWNIATHSHRYGYQRGKPNSWLYCYPFTFCFFMKERVNPNRSKLYEWLKC